MAQNKCSGFVFLNKRLVSSVVKVMNDSEQRISVILDELCAVAAVSKNVTAI